MARLRYIIPNFSVYYRFLYSFQAVPQAVQNNTQVKHHSEVTLNALNAEVDVEGSLDFDSAPPNV